MLLSWVQGLNFACNRRGRDGKLLCDVVQNAACLDNVRLFVQSSFLRKAQLHKTPETPLHRAQCYSHDVVDLCMGLVEADLLVVCRLEHRSQHMLAQVVAFPSYKRDTRQCSSNDLKCSIGCKEV